MLAYRTERYGAGEHQLVVAFVVGERGHVERARGEQLGIGAGHSSRGSPHAFRIQRHAERLKELPRGEFGRGQVRATGTAAAARRVEPLSAVEAFSALEALRGLESLRVLEALRALGAVRAVEALRALGAQIRAYCPGFPGRASW
jgi:hypothetical protein